MQHPLPRVLLAGTASGCGKTTVTCAVLQALTNRGIRAGAFKCGPDYIDPMFHRAVLGIPSANLDPFLLQPDTLCGLLAENADGQQISVLEGAMGFYDGLGMNSWEASSYAVARLTCSPVVLVLNAKGAALSVLAALHGFVTFCPDSGIAGVILNGISGAVYSRLAEAIREKFGSRVRPLGFLPEMPNCRISSRHLGLVAADELPMLHRTLQALAAQASQSLDLDGLLQLAESAPPLQWQPAQLPHFTESIRIAVARDKAFSFYYEDSLRLLARMGAQLIPFSPLEDAAMPQADGLYLGGGYPELYSAALSENAGMRRSIREALEKRLPCIAECGGFMYLTQKINSHPMVGFLPGECRDTGHLVRFGYAWLTAKKDSMLCRRGERIPVHEFHHWDCTSNGEDFTAQKPSGRSWPCVYANDRLYAGFPHLHLCADPRLAENFYKACLEEKHHDRNS